MAAALQEARKQPLLPAPSPRRGDGVSPDGWEILVDPYGEERDDVCSGLWMILRDVHHWRDRAQRNGLFGNRTHKARARLLRLMRVVPALTNALWTFLKLRAQPGTVLASELGAACYGVWAWAEGESLSGTAAHFAEAAAHLVPDNPVYANDAGWACRRRMLNDRAGAWYQRGFRLAVRAKNRHEAIRALIGRGAVYKTTGQFALARHYYDRASSRALNTGRRRQAAVARHYIFALEAEQGSFADGLDAVRETLNLYPIHDRRVPYLAHDYAFLLIRHRYFTAALALLEKIVPTILKPEERVLVHGSIARAAAAAGRYERSHAAAELALAEAEMHPEYAHACYVHLAFASRSSGEWEAAAEYAARGEEIARGLQDAVVERTAAELRAAISARLPPDRENPEACPYEVEMIERMFSVRLRRWLAPDRRGTGANGQPVNTADRERKRL